MAMWVKEGDADAVLYLNDYDILTGNKLEKYVTHIETLLKQGVPLGGIGVQGHLHGDSFDRDALKRALDTLARFELPIRITEFNFPGQRSRFYLNRRAQLTPEEEEAKAEAIVDYYRICFAHPAVTGILMWGFWEGANWIPVSSLYKRDWTPTPAAHAYRNLLFHGPCFQTMKTFDGIDERGALVPVDPTDPEQWLPGVGGDQQWLFDPGLIDTGPQMALVWVNVMRSASALPSRFGRVRRFGSGPLGPCRMYFPVYGEQTEEQVKADVAFVDEGGHLRLFIEEMECTSSPALNRLGGGWKGEIRAAPMAAGTGGDPSGRHASDQS